jgi:hypothetical protein
MATPTPTTENRNAYLVLSLAEVEALAKAIRAKRGNRKCATVILRSRIVHDSEIRGCSGQDWQFSSGYKIEV